LTFSRSEVSKKQKAETVLDSHPDSLSRRQPLRAEREQERKRFFVFLYLLATVQHLLEPDASAVRRREDTDVPPHIDADFESSVKRKKGEKRSCVEGRMAEERRFCLARVSGDEGRLVRCRCVCRRALGERGERYDRKGGRDGGKTDKTHLLQSLHSASSAPETFLAPYTLGAFILPQDWVGRELQARSSVLGGPRRCRRALSVPYALERFNPPPKSSLLSSCALPTACIALMSVRKMRLRGRRENGTERVGRSRERLAVGRGG
jgi:hypothetical protein